MLNRLIKVRNEVMSKLINKAEHLLRTIERAQ